MYYLNSYEKKQKFYYVRKQTKQIALKRMSFSDYHGWLLSWLQSLVLMIKIQSVIFLISHVSYCIILCDLSTSISELILLIHFATLEY